MARARRDAKFGPGHLRGYYREGGRQAWSLTADPGGPPSPAGGDRAAGGGCAADSGTSGEKHLSDLELMRERFAKLLLGEDMSGSGKGVSSAMALSNAITNLAVFGEQKKLEPMSEETRARWTKEIDWLLSVTDYIVEFIPTTQRLKDGRTVEVMTMRQRRDLQMNIPALRKLDTMLLDCLDNFSDIDEFHYATKNDDEQERHDDKWWIPTPKVPPNGLSDATQKWFLQQKDSVNQVLKAAMAINSLVLSEMEIPGSYIESLPKNGRDCLGDSLYKILADDSFDPGYFQRLWSSSSEHKIVDVKNKIEASVMIWKRKLNAKDGKTSWGSEKRGMIEERAETVLLMLKHWYPGLPQSDLEISKIQCNTDVGLAILESYSRVIEGLAFTILSRIEDVLHADTIARNSILEQSRHSYNHPLDFKKVNDCSDDDDNDDDDDESAKTVNSMTLLDFMGWSLDDDPKKGVQEEIVEKSKKMSYIEKLGNSGGLRSPARRD
ncbi:rho guanine nucleotide exchange factor 8-like isoform X2 [Andrographis paniculata]|uniref:rho guanine nucleotide exchange factor 8-like isoform X2 n=1 Tax=Andrographis paniculata TaxID=175694 RepID=UPI0021E9A87B|nr:rho guanine nucleotide exchange factor 8-like isoform X2 [Andrographis paniculata]